VVQHNKHTKDSQPTLPQYDMLAAKKKKGGPCAPGGVLYGFPGPKCALCCLLFSFFGVIMLVVIGSLLEKPYRKLQGEELVEDHIARQKAMNAYYTAIIYAVFVLGCAGRVIWLKRNKGLRVPDEDTEEE